MQNLIAFEYENQAVRVIHDEQGEQWFVAVDVCKVLELTDTSVAMRKLDDDEKTTIRLTPGLIEQGFSDNSKGAGLGGSQSGRSPGWDYWDKPPEGALSPHDWQVCSLREMGSLQGAGCALPTGKDDPSVFHRVLSNKGWR